MKAQTTKITVKDLQAIFLSKSEIPLYLWIPFLFFDVNTAIGILVVLIIVLLIYIKKYGCRVRHIPGSNWPNLISIVYSYYAFYNNLHKIQYIYFTYHFNNFKTYYSNEEPNDRRKIYGCRSDLDLDGVKSDNYELIAAYSGKDLSNYPFMIENGLRNHNIIPCVYERHEKKLEFTYDNIEIVKTNNNIVLALFIMHFEKNSKPVFPWAGGDKINLTKTIYHFSVDS